MSKKTDLIPRLITQVQLRHPLPKLPKKPVPLVELGLVCVLMRVLTQSQAEASLAALRKRYEDLNEARVAQAQELIANLKLPSRFKSYAEQVQIANLVKDYLQEVFQKTHGLDLEELREDIPAGGKLISQMPVLGLTAGSLLLWLAADREVPIHLGLMRFLDRLELISRTSSVKKAQSMIEPLVPKGKELEFTLAFHEMMERWGDADTPIFAEVEALRELPYGKKAWQEWQSQVARAEAQRKKEEERRVAQEKREAELRAREEERERKRQEKEAEAAARKAERQAKAAAGKKKAAGGKKAAAAEGGAGKGAAKKAAAAKPTTAKKSSAKKASTKKAPTKKAPAAKASAAKAPARKAAAGKTGAAKAAAGKGGTRKPASKATTRKKSTVKSRTVTRRR